MATGTRIILKKGSGEPDPLDLEIAEVAVDVVNGDLYTKLQSSEVKNLTSGIDGGTGSSVHIGDTPPDSPQEGQQWMEVPASGDATMWIYDGAVWLQQPGGKDGADGADGTNGSDGLWTDNGGGSISYDGAVTVTGDFVASKSGAGLDTLAIGSDAGLTNQQDYAVAVGRRAGETDQQTYATAVGTRAGFDSQGAGSVSVGAYSGETAQGEYSAAFGYSAGKESQGTGSLGLGAQAGETDQSDYAVGIGYSAGRTSQGQYATAVGQGAGRTDQGDYSTALGVNAGEVTQGSASVSVGWAAGKTSQGAYAVALGLDAGQDTQSIDAVSIGNAAGKNRQGYGAVSLGCQAGYGDQGANSIAIGYAAGYTNQAANSIVISARGGTKNVGEPYCVWIGGHNDKRLYYNGTDEWSFAGGPVTGINGFRQNGAPVIDAKGLITALTTLRNATMDETQDIRESLRSAIDELVAGFEQEIAAMPAGDPQ